MATPRKTSAGTCCAYGSKSPGCGQFHPYIRRNGIEAVPGRTPSYDWSKLTKNRN
jgi:hypothetical protein